MDTHVQTLINSLYKSLDGGDAIILVFLHFSLAFDTIHHNILQDWLGVEATVLYCFTSFLSIWFQLMLIGEGRSCACGPLFVGCVRSWHSSFQFNIYMKLMAKGFGIISILMISGFIAHTQAVILIGDCSDLDGGEQTSAQSFPNWVAGVVFKEQVSAVIKKDFA